MESLKKYLRVDWQKILTTAIATVVIVVIGFLVWFTFWVTTVENYELGFSFDRKTGKIEQINHQGWVIRTPVRYSVHAIDMRPHQLTISANQRVLNAKLVRFNPKGLATFVEWHGRSAGDNVNNLQEILKCYAFDVADGRDCPFLEVIQEITPQQGAQMSTNIVIGVGR